MNQEIALKDSLIRDFMAKNSLAGILLRRRDTFAWVTGGSENYIVRSTEDGFVDLLFTMDKKYCIANRVEKFRVADEELDGLGFEILEYDWWEDKVYELARSIVLTGKLGSDTGISSTENIYEEFRELRYSLQPVEIVRYKRVGQECTAAVEDTCREIEPGMSEHEVCASLMGKAVAKGIDPMVALVASDERILRYRHPIPTEKKVQNYAMVVICGRKEGLVANLTRFVHFGALPDELKRKQEKVLDIEAEILRSTVPGNTVGYVFQRGVQKYAESGYPDEWKLLHQGGATGYLNRDYIVTPNMKKVICRNQAFTWNPSIAGVKLEDTFITGCDGLDVITMSADWPAIAVHLSENVTVYRPDILIK